MPGWEQFLSRFDVVTSQEAETALVSVFSSQAELFEYLEFNGEPRPVVLHEESS